MQTQHSYLASSSPIVLNMRPWSSGSGFTGADLWRQHTLSRSERDRLDELVGQALIDQGVCDRLLIQRDPTLFDAFGLSDDTRRWLGAIRASTLKEFAQAIVAASAAFPARAVLGAL